MASDPKNGGGSQTDLVTQVLECGKCTGYYVGPDVSEDGTTLIGQTADAFENSPSSLVYVTENEYSGKTVQFPDGFEYTFPVKTNKASLASIYVFGKSNYGGNTTMGPSGMTFVGAITGLLNEKGTAADPYVEVGVCESNISFIVALCCDTARSAVDLVCDLVDEHGCSSGGVFIAADQKESWIIELYSGHQYAAMKLPRDVMFISANEFVLTSVQEGPDSRMSAGLVSLASENGFAVWNDDGTFNPRRSYAKIIDYTRMRNWMGTRLFYSDPVDNFEDFDDSPVMYVPRRKIGVKDLMEFTRCRFEGTPHCPEVAPNNNRVVGIESMSFANIIQIHRDLPAPVSSVCWFCMAPSEFGVFMPLSNAVDGCIPEYSESRNGKELDMSTAYGKLKALNVICCLGRSVLKKGVSEYWSELENHYIELYRGVLSDIRDMSSSEASGYLTELAKGMQREILDDAERLYNQCLLHHAMNTKNSQDVVVFPGYFATGSTARRYGWDRSEENGRMIFRKGGREIILEEAEDMHDIMFYVTADGETRKTVSMIWKGDVCLPMACIQYFIETSSR